MLTSILKILMSSGWPLTELPSSFALFNAELTVIHKIILQTYITPENLGTLHSKHILSLN